MQNFPQICLGFVSFCSAPFILLPKQESCWVIIQSMLSDSDIFKDLATLCEFLELSI